MKKNLRLISLLIAFIGVSSVSFAQATWDAPSLKSSVVTSGTTYYVYNVGLEGFLNRGGNWSTQAIVASTPYPPSEPNQSTEHLKWTLTYDEADLVWKFLNVPTGDRYLFAENPENGIVYSDGASDKAITWVLDLVDTDNNYYTIQVPSTYGGYNAEQFLGVNPDVEATNRGYANVVKYNTPSGDDYTKWFFITEADYDLYLAKKALDRYMTYAKLVGGIDLASYITTYNANVTADILEAANELSAELNPFEVTSLITNPSFENGLNGWTNTDPGFWTQTNDGLNPYRDGSYFAERHIGGPNNLGEISITQELTLPNGIYGLVLSAHAYQQSGSNPFHTNAFVFAGDLSTEVSVKGNYFVDFIEVTDGTLTIGYKTEGEVACNWTAFDNFRLYVYKADAGIISLSEGSFVFNETDTEKTFTVSGVGITDDIEFSAPEGISFEPASVSSADAAAGKLITVTWDPTVLGTTLDGEITVSSTGADPQIISFMTSKDSECANFLAPEKNLIIDPYFNNPVQPGWGNHIITSENAYCGAHSGKVWATRGGSIDRSVTWKPETAYLLRTYVNTDDLGFVLGLGKAWVEGHKDNEAYNIIPNTEGEWQLFENGFVTGASAGSEGGLIWFNNYASGKNVTGYIDNMELYEAYAVNFVTGEGSPVAPLYLIKDDNIKITEPVTILLGKNVEGWYTDSEYNTPWDFETDVVDGNKTLYAKWQEGPSIVNVLANPGFDESPHFKAADAASDLPSANAGANIHEVAGWTIGTIGNNSAASTFEYGYAGTLNGQNPPATDQGGGNTGAVLGISTAWGATVAYTQEVTLPLGGRYGIIYNAYNSGPKDANSSKVGWVPNEGEAALSTVTSFAVGEWMKDTIEFVVEEDGAVGKIQVGISAPSTGSANVGRIFFDQVQLIYLGVGKAGLTDKIADAETLYGDGSGNGADALSDAITAAKAVEADDEATQSEVSEAIAALEEAIYAYQLANASAENPVDMTDRIINPSFEFASRYEGWVNNGMGSSTGNPGTLAFTKDGQVFAEKYVGPGNALPAAGFYQVISDLPNGTYVLTASGQARVNENGTDPGYIEGAAIFANHKEEIVSEGKDYTITVAVIDGNLKIGFRVIPEKGNWVAADNYRLTYIGVDVAAMAETLEAIIAEAEALTDVMQDVVATELAEAIAEAETAVATPTEGGISTAGARLYAAIDAANPSIQAYAALIDLIESTNGALDLYEEADKTDITAAVATAQGVYDAATADIAGVESAIEALQDAFNTFAIANADEVPMDMTGFIRNPEFNSMEGWITTTGAQNSALATNQNSGAFAGTMPYWENWNGSPYTGKMYQVITGLPAGKYSFKIGVFANNGGEGLFVYAGENETPVSDASTPAFFSLNFEFEGGELEIGLDIRSGNNNWVGLDNASLTYLGTEAHPVLAVSKSSIAFSEDQLEQVIVITGMDIAANVEFDAPAGISFDPAVVTPAETTGEGKEVTITWDPEVLGTTADGVIVISSEGADTITVNFTTSVDSDCSTILDPANNLIDDPFFNNPSQPGWGNRIITTEEVFCGLTSGKVWGACGGSMDRAVSWEPETPYIIRAYVNTNGEGFVIGLGNAYVEGVQNHEAYNLIPDTEGAWQLYENSFITGADASADNGLIWFNTCNSGANLTGYIDNLELYVAALVTFETNEGSEVPYEIVMKGSLVTEPAEVPEKDGFDFTGWFKDEECETAWNFATDVADDNTTIYAGWKLVGAVDYLNANDPVVSTRYYNLHGVEIVKPTENGIYIKQSVLQSGKVIVSKEYVKYIK
ncbi:MAG TPA: InlB B-repeat-containing protein [Paludibacter sp.]|nr:InlB B-repeat-containing protein [Paludibacter sp.]